MSATDNRLAWSLPSLIYVEIIITSETVSKADPYPGTEFIDSAAHGSVEGFHLTARRHHDISPKYTRISGCIQRKYRGTVLLLCANETTPRPHALEAHNHREYTQKKTPPTWRGVAGLRYVKVDNMTWTLNQAA